MTDKAREVVETVLRKIETLSREEFILFAGNYIGEEALYDHFLYALHTLAEDGDFENLTEEEIPKHFGLG